MSNESKSATVQVTLELVKGVAPASCKGCIFDHGPSCGQPDAMDCCAVGSNNVWKIKQEKDNAN